MKRLSYLILPFVFMFLLMTTTTFNVKAADSCDPDTATLVDITVHYHRWDEKYNYTDMLLHTWDTGKNGSDGGVAVTDGPFGGKAIIKVNPCNAADKIGLIPHPASTWDYKDGIDTDKKDGADNKYIDVTKIKDGTLTSLNVIVFQGSNEVYQLDNVNKPNMGLLFVVYFRPNGDYAAWDTWTWDAGAGGTADAVPFSYNLGIDGQNDPNLFKVAVYNIAADAKDQIGFIVRTADWTKDKDWVNKYQEDFTDASGNKYIIQGGDAGNRLINVSDIKGQGFKVLFAMQGRAEFITDYETFIEEAFKFEISEAKFEKVNSLSVTFNQDIKYDPTKGPKLDKFSIKDDSGKALKINSIGYDSKKESGAEFKFLVDKIDITKTYTLSYEHEGKLDKEIVTKAIVIPDKEAPIIEIAEVDKVITVKQGTRKIAGPDVKAFDNGAAIKNIRAEGIVDTAKPGNYTVTYYAEDDFGNVTSETITVKVESNVMVYWPFALALVVVIAGAGAGVYFTRKK